MRKSCFWLGLAGAGIAAVVVATFRPGDRSWEESTERGVAAIQSGDYRQAEVALADALRRSRRLPDGDPRRVESLWNLGTLYAGEGKGAEAELLLERGLTHVEKQLGPEDAAAARFLERLASLHLRREDLDGAEARQLEARARAIRVRAQQGARALVPYSWPPRP